MSNAGSVVHEGGCLCGAVRYEVRGAPVRSGLCHCLDCRKTSGSLYAAFAVWKADDFSSRGEIAVYGNRGFCPRCGSRIAWVNDGEAEVSLGSMDDAPIDILPDYELWVGRRESWLHALPWADQFGGDRTDAGGEPIPPLGAPRVRKPG
ncbi:GFA family protein [Mesorhizobium sp. CAU 1741]|uniref:GFA family protein n=1 Tax=Mesorhizobium sp. CAU 1741 TaxID=3140366 RepID=UPI00325C1165